MIAAVGFPNFHWVLAQEFIAHHSSVAQQLPHNPFFGCEIFAQKTGKFGWGHIVVSSHRLSHPDIAPLVTPLYFIERGFPPSLHSREGAGG